MIDSARRLTLGLALLVFLIAATVYLITLTPSVPFWDAGEFIAVSKILGIPHPPGTPFYVLLGRIATLVPWHTVAERVNALSAIPAALAVMFTYLTGLKLIRLALGAERSGADDRIAHIGAFVGAMMIAFSDAFWENAIEAEVYSLMSLAQIFVLWLGLRWWEEHERRPTAGPLLLCVYVMWLCVGLHLGVGIMGLPLLVLVALVDRRAALVFALPFLGVLLVTMGLERMAGGVMALSILTYVVFALQKKLSGWVLMGAAVAGLVGMQVAFGDRPFTPGTAFLAVAAVLVPMILLAWRAREGRIMALAFLLMVVGYSTHLYLPIRAAQKPAINEGDPSNWERLRDLLERKQYGQMNMFSRRAPLSVQLNKEFWRYFRRQWPLFSTERIEAMGGVDAQGRSNWLAGRFSAVPWGGLLPLLLGIAGPFWQARRERISFLYTASFVALTTLGMILFLNFSDREVRERDYFFQSGYHAFSLWIGLGVAWLIIRVREMAGIQRPWAYWLVVVALLSLPFWLAKNLWYTHDRRGYYVAHDYAYNMLVPLAPGSFVFTNGDNDTFPLWYMQEVEGVRKDVRVVNLSLLNTDWYIRQLRDQEPRVPMELDENAIQALGMGAVRDTLGNLMYTNEFMVRHIVSVDRTSTGWHQQPYFAVTVPEHMGLEKNFSLEGLVYRVNPDTLRDSVDEPKTRRALYEIFRYRGLFKPDGSWDNSVFKDENASTLAHNYAAAHLQLAFWYRRHGQLPRGIAEMERVARMFPDFTDVVVPLGNFYLDAGDTAKAIAVFQNLTTTDPRNPEAHYYYGVTQVFRGNLDAAVRSFETAIQLDPNYNMAYYAAYYALSESGQRDRALGYLERWVRTHPNDEQARQLLEGQRGLSSETPRQAPIMPTPLPNLP